MTKTSQKIGYAITLIPASVLAIQTLFLERQNSRDQDAVEAMLRKAGDFMGTKSNEIITLDAAIPLILMGGIALPKMSSFFGVTYIVGRTIYKTTRNDKEMEKAGKYIMQGSLIVLAGTALLATLKYFIDK